MSCTSLSSGHQVDGVPLALHNSYNLCYASWKSNTEAVRVFQGFSAQHLCVILESFLHNLEYFRLIVARKITKIY